MPVLKKHDTREAPKARGILGVRVPSAPVTHERILPGAALEPFVAHFWSVRWSLPQPIESETLPHPCVHVVFESNEGGQRAEVTYVHTARFRRELCGRGWVFGVKFRPAAFAGLSSGKALGALHDRVVPLDEVFGEPGRAWAAATFSSSNLEKQMKLATKFLAPRLLPLEARVMRTRDLVERMETDRALTRTRDAARILRVDVRTLERLFHEYVGASPKWVLCRYRLHEAAERLKSASPPSLAALAAALGYSDQAHFARDFRRVIGRTPRAFAAMHADAR
jgi:AraC-like DNA-binding protein